MEEKCDPQIRSGQETATQWLDPGGGGALREYLHTLTNQERLGCEVTVGSLPLELEES
jgi:hypothetical protein